MRTVLSILPTLSREYDRYFKPFDNVPYDLSAMASSPMDATAVSGSSAAEPTATGMKAAAPGADSGVDGEDGDGKDEGGEAEDGDKDEGAEQQTKKPKLATRGSR